MPLSPGPRLGPYEILSAFGSVGTADCRALASGLSRDIAIRIPTAGHRRAPTGFASGPPTGIFSADCFTHEVTKNRKLLIVDWYGKPEKRDGIARAARG